MVATLFEKVINGEFEGSFVFKDDTCAAFMDLNPLSEGHVLVVPRSPVERLANLEPEVAAHLFRVAQRILRAIEASGIPCEGANLFLSDGKIAGQEVPHVHLHIVPRHSGDGISVSFGKAYQRSDRAKLNAIAGQIARHLP